MVRKMPEHLQRQLLEAYAMMTARTHIISYDRASRKMAIFQDDFCLLVPFKEYPDEASAIKAGKDWCKRYWNEDEPEIVFPAIRSIKFSTTTRKKK